MEDEKNEKTDRKGMLLTEWGTGRGEETHKGWGYERVMSGDRIKRKEGGGWKQRKRKRSRKTDRRKKNTNELWQEINRKEGDERKVSEKYQEKNR
jgi:hypothetical protein